MKKTWIEKYLSDLSSDKPRIKYAAAKRLIRIAETDPRSLYPHREFFMNLLASKNNIIKWTAIDIVGGLCCIDNAQEAERYLKVFVDFLRGGKLIAANHAVAALAHVAANRPEHRRRVTSELLRCEGYEYETGECHNIVVGKVILALGLYLNPADLDERVIGFLKRQTSNTRQATRKKAEGLLRRIEKMTA